MTIERSYDYDVGQWERVFKVVSGPTWLGDIESTEFVNSLRKCQRIIGQIKNRALQFAEEIDGHEVGSEAYKAIDSKNDSSLGGLLGRLIAGLNTFINNSMIEYYIEMGKLDQSIQYPAEEERERKRLKKGYQKMGIGLFLGTIPELNEILAKGKNKAEGGEESEIDRRVERVQRRGVGWC